MRHRHLQWKDPLISIKITAHESSHLHMPLVEIILNFSPQKISSIKGFSMREILDFAWNFEKRKRKKDEEYTLRLSTYILPRVNFYICFYLFFLITTADLYSFIFQFPIITFILWAASSWPLNIPVLSFNNVVMI